MDFVTKTEQGGDARHGFNLRYIIRGTMKGDPLEKALINLSKQMLRVQSELRQLKAGLTVLKSTVAMELHPGDPKAFLDELRRFETALLAEVDSEGAEERKRAEKLFDLLLRDDVKPGDHEA